MKSISIGARKAVAGVCFGLLFPGLFSLFVHASEGPRLIREVVVIPERGNVTGYALLSDGVRFSFVPPQDWTVKLDSTKKSLSILSPNLEAGITVSISPPLAEPDANPPVSSRERVLVRYPGARITSEFKCYTAGHDGLAFDFLRTVDSSLKAAYRLAFVPFDGGVVEFEMKASKTKFQKHQRAFGLLLNSFQISREVRAR